MPDQREAAWGWVEVVERRVVFPSEWEIIKLPTGEVVRVSEVNHEGETVYFDGPVRGSLFQSATCDGLYLHIEGSECDGHRLELDTPDNPVGHRSWSVHCGRGKEENDGT